MFPVRYELNLYMLCRRKEIKKKDKTEKKNTTAQIRD
jgi:hypothetical protein